MADDFACDYLYYNANNLLYHFSLLDIDIKIKGKSVTHWTKDDKSFASTEYFFKDSWILYGEGNCCMQIMMMNWLGNGRSFSSGVMLI